MLVYPQLASGALVQFPIQKRQRRRTILNALADGNAIKLADPMADVTEWRLQYAGLSDDEVSSLEQFFTAAEGNLKSFTFLDPTANLFAWSDRLDHAAWVKDPFLSISVGVADPAGGNNGWHLYNSGAGAQRISQTVQGPGAYLYCLSAYVKGLPGGNLTLLRGTGRTDRQSGAVWNRVTSAGHGDPAAEYVEFGIELPPGGSLDVFGFQVEPQAGASGYKPSKAGGVYPEASFRDEFLSFTATDVNRHSATVNIIHAKRL